MPPRKIVATTAAIISTLLLAEEVHCLSSYGSFATWSAANEALHSAHVKSTVVNGAVDVSIFRDDSFASARQISHGGAEAKVVWREGALEEGTTEIILGGIVAKLWPVGADGDAATPLVDILTDLATEYGKCLNEHGLLEETGVDMSGGSSPPLCAASASPIAPSSSSQLRVRVVVQDAPSHFGRTERCFHRDYLTLRLVCCLQGEGTVVLEDAGVPSEATWRKARLQYYDDERAEEEEGKRGGGGPRGGGLPSSAKKNAADAHNDRVVRGGDGGDDDARADEGDRFSVFECPTAAGDALLLKGNGWLHGRRSASSTTGTAISDEEDGETFCVGTGAVHRSPARLLPAGPSSTCPRSVDGEPSETTTGRRRVLVIVDRLCDNLETQDMSQSREATAVEYRRKAMRTGDAEAQYYFATMAQAGWGVLQNCSEAEEWFRRAAEQGHAQAQFRLGELLVEETQQGGSTGGGDRRADYEETGDDAAAAEAAGGKGAAVVGETKRSHKPSLADTTAITSGRFDEGLACLRKAAAQGIPEAQSLLAEMSTGAVPTQTGGMAAGDLAGDPTKPGKPGGFGKAPGKTDSNRKRKGTAAQKTKRDKKKRK